MTPVQFAARPKAVQQSLLSARGTIWYCYEQGRVDGARIHLGEIGEIALPSFRQLCMVARRELRDEELDRIGEVGRKLLHKPFDYLSAEITRVWKDAERGKTVLLLSSEFSRSLLVTAPISFEVPEHFAKFHQPALSGFVESYLFGVLKVALEENIGSAGYRIEEDDSGQLALAA